MLCASSIEGDQISSPLARMPRSSSHDSWSFGHDSPRHGRDSTMTTYDQALAADERGIFNPKASSSFASDRKHFEMR